MEIHETVCVSESIKVKIIRGSWKNRLFHLVQDLVNPIKERLAEIKRQRERQRIPRADKQIRVSEAYYFIEQEWSGTPATELLKRAFDTLEVVVNEVSAKFGEPPLNTNDG